MSLKNRPTRFVLLTLTIGLAMRALIPAGYMPGSLEGGSWFVLCSSNLPAGFSVSAVADEHHHRGMHGDAAGSSVVSGDCSFGHILSGAMIPSDLAVLASRFSPAAPVDAGAEQAFIPGTTVLRPRTRAPPLAS